MKKIGILTSGGDAPGMNSVIHAAVRKALKEGLEVVGIKKGFYGLVFEEVMELDAKSVCNINNFGGTMLISARCKELFSDAGQQKAVDCAKKLGLDAIIAIGGDGTFRGAKKLAARGLPIIGIPGTIDLDIDSTDYTIGFDTAVNTVVDAIGKLTDTLLSHQRCSVVEVMGRDNGSIALWSALATGADDVLVPEMPDVSMGDVVEQISNNREKGKMHHIVVVSEGLGPGASVLLANTIEEYTGISTKATILGHLQRGGRPSALDRTRGAHMGTMAVNLLKDGTKDCIIVFRNGKYDHIPFSETTNCKKEFDLETYKMVRELSY